MQSEELLRVMRVAFEASRTPSRPSWDEFRKRLHEITRDPKVDEGERWMGNYAPAIKRAPERLSSGTAFFTSEGYLRDQGRANWAGVPISMRVFAARVVETCRKFGVPMYVHTAFRTREEQQRMVATGRSNTHWPRAAHCQGKAVDIVHSRFAWDMTRDEWQWLGKVGKDVAASMRLPITWGGDWSFYDPAHWELTGWEDDISLREPLDPVQLTARKILRDNKGYEYRPA